jgi:hypothetical protein
VAAAEQGPAGAAARQRAGGVNAPATASPPAARPDAVAEAEQEAARKLDVVFNRSVCADCHEITPPAESARGVWEVQPVKVAALWMPKAFFDHAAHSTTPCTDCHRATESSASGDVLMPAIADCRTCHRGELAATALPSTCIMCHVYHRDDLAPMLPRTPPATAAPAAGVATATPGR